MATVGGEMMENCRPEKTATTHLPASQTSHLLLNEDKVNKTEILMCNLLYLKSTQMIGPKWI